MDIQITYAEIAEYCVKKIKLSPSFTCHDERTLEIYYRPISFLPPISFKIRIEAVQDETVFLSYDCGNATSMVFNGVIAYLENTIPQEIPKHLSLEKVFLYGRQHEVANIAFLSIDKLEFVDKELYNKWKRVFI